MPDVDGRPEPERDPASLARPAGVPPAAEPFAVGGWVDFGAERLPRTLLLLGRVTDDALLYVGHVRVDPAGAERSGLRHLVEEAEQTVCPFTRPPRVEAAHWCAEGVAVDVQFDGQNAIGRLRGPMLRLAPPSPAASGPGGGWRTTSVLQPGSP
ncbi:hypothetical protein [Solicola sp. PLA-1-18]|uniref:hypothetical protein n=1 Tax=Solicola sp. PLA-1-18 TaxID=3380532 RepID=UPI003B76E00B